MSYKGDGHNGTPRTTYSIATRITILFTYSKESWTVKSQPIETDISTIYVYLGRDYRSRAYHRDYLQFSPSSIWLPTYPDRRTSYHPPFKPCIVRQQFQEYSHTKLSTASLIAAASSSVANKPQFGIPNSLIPFLRNKVSEFFQGIVVFNVRTTIGQTKRKIVIERFTQQQLSFNSSSPQTLLSPPKSAAFSRWSIPSVLKQVIPLGTSILYRE